MSVMHVVRDAMCVRDGHVGSAHVGGVRDLGKSILIMRIRALNALRLATGSLHAFNHTTAFPLSSGEDSVI
jgi:hypothetical protein